MWIFTPESFVSVVADSGSLDKKLKRLVARGRFPGDIERFLEGATVTETRDSDYRFRTFAPRAEIAAALHAAVSRINYDNFKASVIDVQRHTVYSRVWQLMADAQEQSLDRHRGDDHGHR